MLPLQDDVTVMVLHVSLLVILSLSSSVVIPERRKQSDDLVWFPLSSHPEVRCLCWSKRDPEGSWNQLSVGAWRWFYTTANAPGCPVLLPPRGPTTAGSSSRADSQSPPECVVVQLDQRHRARRRCIAVTYCKNRAGEVTRREGGWSSQRAPQLPQQNCPRAPAR